MNRIDSSLPLKRDADPEVKIDAYGAVTHEVINQPVELAGVNLYAADAALREAGGGEVGTRPV